jgi:hypothetical protein
MDDCRESAPPAGVPVEETNLTPDEIALLPDPSVVTEDDADAITIYRRRRENPRLVAFDTLLKQYGLARRRSGER